MPISANIAEFYDSKSRLFCKIALNIPRCTNIAGKLKYWGGGGGQVESGFRLPVVQVAVQILFLTMY